jgi:hypothetical protein
VAGGGVGQFSYGAVLRLLNIAGRFWYEIDGACARTGVDPLDLPLDRFLSLILDWTQEHVDPEKWDQARADIFAPLVKDVDNVPQSVIDEEMDLFATFTRQQQALEGGR